MLIIEAVVAVVITGLFIFATACTSYDEPPQTAPTPQAIPYSTAKTTSTSDTTPVPLAEVKPMPSSDIDKTTTSIASDTETIEHGSNPTEIEIDFAIRKAEEIVRIQQDDITLLIIEAVVERYKPANTWDISVMSEETDLNTVWKYELVSTTEDYFTILATATTTMVFDVSATSNEVMVIIPFIIVYNHDENTITMKAVAGDIKVKVKVVIRHKSEK